MRNYSSFSSKCCSLLTSPTGDFKPLLIQSWWKWYSSYNLIINQLENGCVGIKFWTYFAIHQIWWNSDIWSTQTMNRFNSVGILYSRICLINRASPKPFHLLVNGSFRFWYFLEISFETPTFGFRVNRVILDSNFRPLTINTVQPENKGPRLLKIFWNIKLLTEFNLLVNGPFGMDRQLDFFVMERTFVTIRLLVT